MTSVIQSQLLSKRFGSNVAVSGGDLDVTAGTIHGLVGPNEADRSTILRMLVDII